MRGFWVRKTRIKTKYETKTRVENVCKLFHVTGSIG